jgi:hypothetical protein
MIMIRIVVGDIELILLEAKIQKKNLENRK